MKDHPLESGRPAAEIHDEVEHYLEERARELEAEGLSPLEARAAAERAFGDRRRFEAAARPEAARRWTLSGWFTNRVADLRVSLRSLGRSPTFTLAAMVLIGLGVGGTSAIYSLARGIFLRPLPVSAAGDLVAVYTSCRNGHPRCPSSFPDYRDYTTSTPLLDDLAAWTGNAFNVAVEGASPERWTAHEVTGNYFDVLGLRPSAGRLLQPADDDPATPRAVAVLAHNTWNGPFGSDPEVVGRTLRLNGVAFEIVGVAPPGFRGTDLTGDPAFFLPLSSRGLLSDDPDENAVFESRGSRWIGSLVGRLRAGADIDAVQAELDGVSIRLNEAFPDERQGRIVTVDPLDRYALPQFGRDELTRIVGLLGTVVVLTLILATTNLANLLLARASARETDVGVRVALGAGRWRIVAFLLHESVLLSLGGALLGLAIARGLLGAVARFELPGGVSPAALGVGLDAPVFVFAMATATCTGLLLSLVPVARLARGAPTVDLRTGAALGRRSGRGMQSALIVAQVALCLVLLVGSGLFLRSLQAALRSGLGYRPQGLALARFSLGDLGLTATEARTTLDEMRARVAALPGAVAVSYASRVPQQVGGASARFGTIAGYEAAPDEEIRIELVAAGPDFLRTLGVVPVDGSGDVDPIAAPAGAWIDRSMADRYWNGLSAVGASFQAGGLEATVAGVIRSVAWEGVATAPENLAILPYSALPGFAANLPVTMAVRVEGSATAALVPLQTALREVAPATTFLFTGTGEELVATTLAPQRLGALVLTVFALLALIVAALGIASVVAYAVATRRSEIGLRLALGASREAVVAVVLRRVLTPVALGIGMGLIGATLLSGAMATFLVEVDPVDPATFGGVVGVLALVAGAAAAIPARAAARVDPMRVLGSE